MVFEKVKAILSEQFDVEEDSITAETTLADDLAPIPWTLWTC